EVEGLLSALKDAETGQRGFLLTGEDDYLEPYRRATQDPAHSLSQRMLRLREALADRPEQTPRLDEIDRQTTRKLEELDSSLRAYKTDGRDAAVRVVASGRGKRAMDAARALAEEVRADELRNLDASRTDARRCTQNVMLTILLGALISAGLG